MNTFKIILAFVVGITASRVLWGNDAGVTSPRWFNRPRLNLNIWHFAWLVLV